MQDPSELALEQQAEPSPEPAPAKAPTGGQLKLSDRELGRLARRIRQDFSDAVSDHQARMNKFLRFYRSWRARVGGEGGELGHSNFHVPLIKWQVFTKWAKEVDALLGDDAEIVAVPTQPADEKIVRKVGRYMTWRVFTSMQITTELIIFLFHKLLFGRAFAYAPYCVEKFDVPGEGEQVAFEGVGFKTIWPDNIITPAEDVQSVQDFSFVIRRYRETVDDLLEGEANRIYQGIEENFEAIYRCAQQGIRRGMWTGSNSSLVQQEKDKAEGVLYEYNQSARNAVEVWEWYGKWRMLKGRGDGTEDNFKRRDLRERDLLIRFIPELDLIIGVQDLAEIYPKMKDRRPIVEASLVKDGSYWGPSMPELLEDIEMELSATHNLATEGGEASISPLMGYKPGAGFDPKVIRYAPRLAIPMDNPATDLKQYPINFNPEFPVMRQQELIAISERLTGLTDQNIGRSIDRPNAPRTARGQLALLDEGSVRINLDTRVIREDLRRVLQHIWNVDSMYAADELFFRATGEDFEFDKISKAERQFRFDFDLKFATSVHSKEARKQERTIVYQAVITNPLVAKNPQATWLALDDLLKAYDLPGMARYMPQPGPLDMPEDPKSEWFAMLQGEEVEVHPQDPDPEHLAQHHKDLQKERAKPVDKQDNDAQMRMMYHIGAHEEQAARKQAVAQATAALSSILQPLMAGGPASDQGNQAGTDLMGMLNQTGNDQGAQGGLY